MFIIFEKYGTIICMIEKLYDNIYRISVPLPENPLKALNSYFIRGKNRDLLIDLGFRRQECRDALAQGLEELGSAAENRDILLTHMHPDHSGLANDFVGKGRRIYIGSTDLEYLKKLISREAIQATNERLISEGFPEALIAVVDATSSHRIHTLACVTPQFYGLNDGDEIRVGDFCLKTVLVPGHTPGCAMFWMEEQKIMFTGDHVLFDITPNITAWSIMEDALGDYLESLRRSLAYPVELALPSHRASGNYHDRIRELLVHHDHRIKEARDIVHTYPGLSAYEIASHMKWQIRADSWDSFPPIQKWFAVGECLSHLDYLRKRRQIRREMENGTYRYFSVI